MDIMQIYRLMFALEDLREFFRKRAPSAKLESKKLDRVSSELMREIEVALGRHVEGGVGKYITDNIELRVREEEFIAFGGRNHPTGGGMPPFSPPLAFKVGLQYYFKRKP